MQNRQNKILINGHESIEYFMNSVQWMSGFRVQICNTMFVMLVAYPLITIHWDWKNTKSSIFNELFSKFTYFHFHVGSNYLVPLIFYLQMCMFSSVLNKSQVIHCCCFDAQNEIDDGSRGQVWTCQWFLQLKASSANDHLTMTDCSETSTVRTAVVL